MGSRMSSSSPGWTPLGQMTPMTFVSLSSWTWNMSPGATPLGIVTVRNVVVGAGEEGRGVGIPFFATAAGTDDVVGTVSSVAAIRSKGERDGEARKGDSVQCLWQSPTSC